MKNLIICFFTILLYMMTTSATGTEEINQLSDMTDSKRCLSLRSINKTKIIDKQNILFYVRGKKLYRNTLPIKCNGLMPDSIISYDVSMGQLCRMDMIKIQERIGRQLFSSGSCSLGVFEQIPSLEELTEND